MSQMRLRGLLTATALGATLLAASAGSARAEVPPDLLSPGPLVTWGGDTDPSSVAAIAPPNDVSDGLVRDVSFDAQATAAAVRVGGVDTIRVWGTPGSHEVVTAPTDVTDASGVAISPSGGLVVHAIRGTTGVIVSHLVTGWGSAALEQAPTDNVVGAALSPSGTAYAVLTSGGLVQWGAEPAAGPIPAGLDTATAQLADVSANSHQVLALRKDGTVVSWSDPAFPAFTAVPDFGGEKVTQIATGATADGVVLADGSIRIWGPSVPAGQPDFGSHKVISLSLGKDNAGAITDDGTVHVWGASADLNAVPTSLNGQSAASITMGAERAAVVVTFKALAPATTGGTPEVGKTMTATPAIFPFTSAAGQWYADYLPIKGATGTTLKVDDSLVGSWISYRSTATRGGAEFRSESAPIGPVSRTTSSVRLSVAPAKAPAGKSRTVTAIVTRDGGTAGGRVAFALDNKSRIIIMSGGKAVLKLPNLAVGSHTITATYSGSPSTAPSTATPVKFKVTKAASKVSAKAKARGGTATITVNTHASKRVSARGKVTIKLKGKTKKTIHTKVDARGRATVTIKHLKHGTYKAVVKYAGNKSTKGSKTTKKFRT